MESDNKGQRAEVVELIKKWHRSGFISVSYWNSADKVIIEIGSTDPDNNNALKNVSKCFLPSFQFLAYLHSEVHCTVEKLFPAFAEKGISYFGGTPKPPVTSRVFNSSYYKDYRNNNVIDYFYRTFTCASYEGTVKDKGIVSPNFKAELSKNTIKISMADISETYQMLNMHMLAENTADIVLGTNE